MKPDISEFVPASEYTEVTDEVRIDSRGRTLVGEQATGRKPSVHLSEEEAAKHYRESSDKFYNESVPSVTYTEENPRHRLICYLKAQGKSNKEVAELVGCTPVTVSQVYRQPWARARIAEELRIAGRDAIEGVIASAALDSVYKLIEIRDSNAPAHVQLNAASSLLDRFLGKPTQKVESNSTVTTVSADVNELKRELEANNAEMRRLGLSAGGSN